MIEDGSLDIPIILMEGVTLIKYWLTIPSYLDPGSGVNLHWKQTLELNKGHGVWLLVPQSTIKEWRNNIQFVSPSQMDGMDSLNRMAKQTPKQMESFNFPRGRSNPLVAWLVNKIIRVEGNNDGGSFFQI